MIFLRLTDVDISKVADLTAACSGREPYTREGPRVWHFVDIRSIQFEKSGGVAQVDLKINDEYDRISIEAPPFKPGEEKTSVTREQLNVLLDILEIFPRENQSQTTLGEVREPLQFILKNLEAIHDAAKKKVVFGEPESSIFREISELARTAILRAAALQLVE